MGRFFKDDFHDEVGTWPLGYIPYGGADFGEVLAVVQVVGDGDDSAFYDAWIAAGDRLVSEALIRCPTLITAAEKDSLSADAVAFCEALKCEKALLKFSQIEGAGDYCEMMNRSLLNRRVLDWLDATLAR